MVGGWWSTDVWSLLVRVACALHIVNSQCHPTRTEQWRTVEQGGGAQRVSLWIHHRGRRTLSRTELGLAGLVELLLGQNLLCMCDGNLNFIFENDLMRRKVNLSCLTDIERDTTF